MLLGLKMIYSIQYTIIYIYFTYYILYKHFVNDCVPRLGHHHWVCHWELFWGWVHTPTGEVLRRGEQLRRCCRVDQMAMSWRKETNKVDDTSVVYVTWYNMKSLEKHLRFVHQKDNLTDVKTWSLHSDTSTTALWHGGYSLKQQLWTHSVWCFKCASGNASSSFLRYGSSIERQFMLASMTWIDLSSVTAKALAEAVKSNEAAVPLADEQGSIHCTFNIRSTSMINAWPQVPRCCCLELDA